MNRVDTLLAEYGSFHRTRGNLICHSVGIPLIVYGILAILREIPLPLRGWTAAELMAAAALVFYACLDFPLALALFVPIALLDIGARAAASWKLGVAAFAVGWVFQGVGHARYEKNKPAFLRNLVHLLTGPLFLINELLRLRPSLPAKAPEH
jgi:uncharacterized membrane protein YGL010W